MVTKPSLEPPVLERTKVYAGTKRAIASTYATNLVFFFSVSIVRQLQRYAQWLLCYIAGAPPESYL